LVWIISLTAGVAAMLMKVVPHHAIQLAIVVGGMGLLILAIMIGIIISVGLIDCGRQSQNPRGIGPFRIFKQCMGNAKEKRKTTKRHCNS
jgi:hypothetical protein